MYSERKENRNNEDRAEHARDGGIHDLSPENGGILGYADTFPRVYFPINSSNALPKGCLKLISSPGDWTAGTSFAWISSQRQRSFA
jgi:hypothetical protein